jgi:dye decolorizing peroxidase
VDPAQPQAYVWVGGFDLLPGTGIEPLRELLRRWTAAAERLTAGEPLGAGDDAVVAGSGPAALTVTVGFGPTLFGQAGVPRDARPMALEPLPAFDGETLDPARGDGDLGLVVAADDPVVVAHASRVLTREAVAAARLRWQHQGFNTARGTVADSATRRNLMGQVDGTNNPRAGEPDFEARVFASGDAPQWMRGGSYLVVRRIRMLLDDWDTLSTVDKERVVGRRLSDGAPLTGGDERTPAHLGALDAGGGLIIPADAHMRLAAPAANQGAAMLRRGFSFVDADGGAGLLFLAWQSDPRHGFIPVQRALVGRDALGRFIRHEASALFAVPGGLGSGSYLGQSLVEPL